MAAVVIILGICSTAYLAHKMSKGYFVGAQKAREFEESQKKK